MRVLIIYGSPMKPYQWSGVRTTSFTAKLVDEVLGELERLGEVEREEIRLADAGLPYCVGCMNCFYKGEGTCPHAGSIQPIVRAIGEADCVIMTSPVYALHVSALVKSFFDHTAYLFHRPCFFDKRALVISSTAGAGAKGACRYMRDTLMHWGFNRVNCLSVMRRGATDPDEKTRSQARRAADKLSLAVNAQLKKPSFKRVAFYQVWRQMARVSDGADHRYWAQSGLDQKVFSPVVPLDPVRRFVGVMMNAVFGRLFR